MRSESARGGEPARAAVPMLSEEELETRPALSSRALLRQGTPEARAIVVLPERAVELQGSSEQILKLCDGARTARAVSEALRDLYPEARGLEDDVRRFIAQMCRLGVLELRSG